MFNIYAQQINLWAVLLSAILAMGAGFIWYLPQVLGNTWAKEVGLKMEEMQSSPFPFVIMFVGLLVLSTTLAWLIKATSADTYLSVLRLSVGLWAALTLVPMVSNYMFAKRSWKLIAIDSLYHLVNVLIISSVLFFWK